jgi:hypothetical protein
MTTDENWMHEDNVPAYRKEALLLQTNHRRWEKGKNRFLFHTLQSNILQHGLSIIINF